ncbi:MAG TPA: hypothetical protein VFN74_23320 [Chloroflexota bacterium]|nr:hypothetical protein [Chloroflexota bacterium]
MAALTVPLTLRRHSSRRRSVAEYLAMASVTVAIFTGGVLFFERVTNTPLVSRIFAGTIAARTRADYSVSFMPRIRPQRATVHVVTTPTPGTSR